MIDVLMASLATLVTFEHLLFMCVGVVVGLIVGILPALGGIAGMSLLLPFIYGMEPTSAIAMMIGLLAILPTSDTFSSILMGIPGSAASQATVLDGFPLARQGQAARALSAAFASSLFGGLFGAVVLTAAVVVARPLILSFSSAELFMLAIFGLSMVGVLSGNNLAKGVAACALGLAVGVIGTAPAAGAERMTFGSLYLMSGIELSIVGLGIFALPEVIDLLRKDQSVSVTGKLGSGWVAGLIDTWRHRWLTIRCSGLGAVVGMVPGLGASVADWLAYGHTVQTSRQDPAFGKGDIRGVIGPESANNACAGGALVPTLLFGIPGSGSTAIFLAAMILIGVQPGPAMADPKRSLDLTYTIIWTLALANVVGTIMCIVLTPWVARLTTIRSAIFGPFMLVVISFGAFQTTRSFTDLVTLLCLGFLGILLKRFGWPRPAFLIGFVLSGQIEVYFYQAVQFYGFAFPLRPMALTIGVLAAISIWFGSRGKDSTKGVASELADDGDMPPSKTQTLVFTAAAFVGFYLVILDSMHLTFLDKAFPAMVGSIGLLSCITIAIGTCLSRRGLHALDDVSGIAAKSAFRGSWIYLGWFAAFVGLVGICGYLIGLIAFFMIFTLVVAKTSLRNSLLLTTAAAFLILSLTWALNMQLPSGALQTWSPVLLPWPFG